MLGEGLEKGFGGSTNIQKVERGSFELTSSHYEGNNGTYHDEWVNGGGQELVRGEDGKAMTRTYVGNVIEKEGLENLGITEKDVMSVLKKVITEHSNSIRFDKDYNLTIGDWLYTYKVIYRRENPFVITGIEEIYYKNQSVFVHVFGISNVVE